jgi:diguanylate cyclase (GGDEF)-like protein/PAS domain S-box-containing protein
MVKSTDQDLSIEKLKRSLFGLTLSWSVTLLTLGGIDFWRTYKGVVDDAKSSANESVRKDLLYRRWAAHHGGVYVPVSPQTPPNPYLADVPERDITTPSGKKLTLINPSYMTRQVHELAAQESGSRGHITSLKPLRPENAPDAWESQALQSFEAGAKESSSFEQSGAETYFRFMRPLVMDSECLHCHEGQGYKLGDIRGGISVAVPWEPYRKVLQNEFLIHIVQYGAIWLFGMWGLRVGRKRLQHYLAATQQAQEFSRQSADALREGEERYRKAFNTSTDAININRLSDGLYIDVNEGFLRLTGWERGEVLGKTSLEIAIWHNPLDRKRLVAALQNAGVCENLEATFRTKDGRLVQALMSANLMQLHGEQCILSVTRDISDRIQAKNEIQSLAFSDPLTGLSNRRLLLDRLHQAIATSARQQRMGAVLLIDIDDFKSLNDTRGHDKGDLLLKEVARRLSACVRDGDTVARLSSDDFVVLMEGLSKSPKEIATQAKVVGEKILNVLHQPYQLGDYEHHGSASIGVTVFGEVSDSNLELLKRAELAMYQAKAAGRNALRFFDPEMQASITNRVALEHDLREALDAHQFTLYYQAQVNSDGAVHGAEALLRWINPKRGMVSPAEFIPFAEETGIILPLGAWVMESACKQLALWASSPEMAHWTIAVNVSALQFKQNDFVERVFDVLDRTGADASRLKLELTESLLVTDVEGIIAKMNALKGRGIGFSLDDFGTGYSSLSYLKRLPLDQLKIDQGFVRDILVDPNDAAIAEMVVALAKTMGLRVIAEGVETAAQKDALLGLGCHAFQGYLFSKPVPVEEFEKLNMVA